MTIEEHPGRWPIHYVDEAEEKGESRAWVTYNQIDDARDYILKLEAENQRLDHEWDCCEEALGSANREIEALTEMRDQLKPLLDLVEQLREARMIYEISFEDPFRHTSEQAKLDLDKLRDKMELGE